MSFSERIRDERIRCGLSQEKLAKHPQTAGGRWKRRGKAALLAVCGYLVIYLLGRIFCSTGADVSIMGWLFGTDPGQLTYLFGWLLKQNVFWAAMAVSLALALLGKELAAWTSVIGCSLGLLLGSLFGANPKGAAYGQGDYGWLIWGGIFLLAIGAGTMMEIHGRCRKKQNRERGKSRRLGLQHRP